MAAGVCEGCLRSVGRQGCQETTCSASQPIAGRKSINLKQPESLLPFPCNPFWMSSEILELLAGQQPTPRPLGGVARQLPQRAKPCCLFLPLANRLH